MFDQQDKIFDQKLNQQGKVLEKKLDEKFEKKLDQKLSQQGKRFDQKLDKKFKEHQEEIGLMVKAGFDSMDDRFTEQETRFNQIDQVLKGIKQRLGNFEKRLDINSLEHSDMIKKIMAIDEKLNNKADKKTVKKLDLEVARLEKEIKPLLTKSAKKTI